MKKIIVLLVILASARTYAQEWKTISLSENVTVSLPGAAVEDNSKGFPMQKVTLPDSTIIFAGVIDYSLLGMDADMLQKMAGTDDFKQNMEAQIGAQPGVTLVKNDAGKYEDKYFSYDMILNIEKNNKKTVVNTRTVFFNQYGVSITYKPGMKGEDAELKNKVFNSIKISE